MPNDFRRATVVAQSTELDAFFAQPALLKGESKRAFRKLEEAISKQLDPADFFDRLDVREIASAVWQAERYRKLIAAVANVNRRQAYENLTTSIFGYISEKQEKSIKSMRGKTKKEILESVGLSIEVLQAQTILRAQRDIPVLQRMLESEILSRKGNLQEYERRKAVRAAHHSNDNLSKFLRKGKG